MSRTAAHETVAVGRIMAGRVVLAPKECWQMTLASSSTACGIESSDIWKAARRFDLYARSDAELCALITRHRGGPLFVDRVTVDAAQHVRDLRRALAGGHTY